MANYNETNGIIVGPEISRIFAEIILQQIDINVLNKIELSDSYKYGIDFEIRRYVDDFFVFSNDEKLLRLIKETYQKELEKYKLYLNPSKDDVKITPFLSDITVGKWEINNALKEFFKSKLEEAEIEKDGQQIKVKIIQKISSPYKEAQYFIKDFQCIVKRNNLTYDLLSKEIIRYFKKSIVKILKDDKVIKEKEKMYNFLLMYFDILFYSYSLNINANTTFKVSQIIVLVCKYLAQMDDELRHAICSKIFKDADFVLTNNQRKSKLNDTNVETLNLIIALKYLGKEYLLSEKRLLELFELKQTDGFSRLNYFQIITLLYYFENIDLYNGIKANLENEVVKRYSVELDPFTKSEFTLLFFDFICCPFVGIESKRKVMRHSKYAVTNSSNELIDNKIHEIMDKKRWFMDWDVNIDLERVLKKKEWGSSY
ncbi:MAG: RNA-directed DNA polymerase [Saprospiraceae bacterium]|nr:RNA-directed DNA polymerase [Saprospiraceae bacterium]